MLVLRFASLLVAVAATAYAAGQTPTVEQTLQQIQQELKALNAFKDTIEQRVGGLARQLMVQQLYVEERTRSDGGSGVKQIRSNSGGTKPYHYTTQSTFSVNSIHEHSNYDRTVGMGEFIAVLNGLEFRTRHNDYKLKMPSTTSSTYNEVEDIPFPDVPPSVLSKPSVQEQVQEMQMYFKAFHEQDTSIRNYKQYFKPVLCYMEGGWTVDTKNLAEPFESDRHHLDADSWYDLLQKVMYTSASGGKSQLENYSFLPTTIINVTETGEPVYAQWNYRILCHPIKREFGLNYLDVIDDLAPRALANRNMTVHEMSKAARFKLDSGHRHPKYSPEVQHGHVHDRRYPHGIIDDIMYEIPGKENYQGNLQDDSFGLIKYRIDVKNQTALNVARYHRHFKVLKKGAMGLSVRNRGFSDPSMFVAKTTNPAIAELKAKECEKSHHHHHSVCHEYTARHTYAIPLEIIWLTPLSKWNPYNLKYQDRNYDVQRGNGRNGGFTVDKAFNGTARDSYYQTPIEFFQSGGGDRDPADTAQDAVGVLDTHGNVRNMTASGIRIFTPKIPGVGSLRIRYPIMPFHQEGSAVDKTLVALQDIVMDMSKFSHMFENAPNVQGIDGQPETGDTTYHMVVTHMNPPGTHTHELHLSADDMALLAKNGTTVSVFTSESNGHQHELVLERATVHPEHRLKVVSCDGGAAGCWDHHGHFVFKN